MDSEGGYRFRYMSRALRKFETDRTSKCLLAGKAHKALRLRFKRIAEWLSPSASPILTRISKSSMRALRQLLQLRQRPELFQAPAEKSGCPVFFFTSSSRLVLPARAACNHSRNSSCRNLHCRPTLIAGISLHSAHRQTARVEMPSHLATAAVVNSISEFDSNFSMGFRFAVFRSFASKDATLPWIDFRHDEF